MNKFEAINKVMVSHLGPENKCLLVELIVRADEEWKCWPSVARLCKVRGIKHEKNFKGADFYLPEFVSVRKVGKKNWYYINTAALDSMLDEAEVVMYQGSWQQRNEELTPALEGVLTPAHAEVTPAHADLTPATEGVNTTKNTTEDITRDTTESVATAGAVSPDLPTFELRLGLNPLNFQEIETSKGFTYFLSEDGVTRLTDTTSADTPATEGVTDADKGAQYLERLMKINNITGPKRDRAERRYWDEEYHPEENNGVKRAGFVITFLSKVDAA